MFEEIYIIGLVAIASIGTMLGCLFITTGNRWLNNREHFFSSVSAGLILSISFLELIPESISLSQNNTFFILLGFSCMYLLHHLLGDHSRETSTQTMKSWKLILLGMILHSFFDGVAIASSFKINTDTGYLVFVGVMLHKIPEGLIVSSISFAYHLSRTKAYIFGVYVSIATLLGAILIIVIEDFFVHEGLMGAGLAFISGILVFLAFTLLSLVHQSNYKKHSIYLIFIGISIALVNHYFHF